MTAIVNPMDLTGRTVIVTGAGQGVGKALSTLVCNLGGNIVLVERNPDTLAAAVKEFPADRALGGGCGGWQEDAHTDRVHNLIAVLEQFPQWAD